MINYDLPYGFCRRDSVAGTITRASFAGIEVVLDADSSETTGVVKAFVRCGGKIGQRVLVSLQYFNKKRENFFATLDGYLDDGPMTAAELVMETEEQCAMSCAA